MHKSGIWWMIAAIIMLASCGTEKRVLKPSDVPGLDVIEKIGGAEPVYEPYTLYALKDYSINGKLYQIVRNPENFSETGGASWYGEEASGRSTILGELIDPDKFTAAHPVLPLPCYVRVTNLSNNRKIIVRINDRGSYASGEVIDLSRAAADHLDLTHHPEVRIDFINVSPDGLLSGPGTSGTVFARQSYALPARPDINPLTNKPEDIRTVTPIAPDDAQVATHD